MLGHLHAKFPLSLTWVIRGEGLNLAPRTDGTSVFKGPILGSGVREQFRFLDQESGYL